MGETLYTPEILRLALSTASFTRLTAPDGTAERRSPVCGSRVTVDIKLDEAGHIADVGQEVRACAFGQAAAALMQGHAIGRSLSELIDVRDRLRGWLASEHDSPGDWPGLGIFDAARPHTARHPAIMLAFDAIVEAAEHAR